ncbi:MAG: restriction endonuclease subunit M/S [Planctomycetes bacterium]|nr:restriction endonuclease subunit M/S [Planctomycetota bacterium]
MLDTITKKRIDDCRDILVGKLPDPKAQIEQITIGLIYKFMADMDKEAIDLGGKAKFFSDYTIQDPKDEEKEITIPFSNYSWDRLFDTKVTASEMLRLYQEAIEGMEKNPNIPQLFRDIFNNAYLPYRDPETLKLFLKTIGEFEYTHSEKLGDAFEYLLSVMGSQGDAGQFRTPRHIIDFLVAIVDPSKTDTVMDPACGTAGFLISAFKYIKEKNNNELTPDQRKKLIQNFVGYDISPDMVRLSLVNLYLHGFSEPHIFEYDTLSSEERWNDNFDVILANPPFMSPKGGIRPHKKFTIDSKRSEVLFVDYIAEHLTPKGKAGIIVPEGIMFQNAKAYQDLRKMLIDNYLWAVVSLPSGLFNPYSGVKTSILLLDKDINRKQSEIIFVEISNTGISLGATNSVIKENDLPLALQILKEYKKGVKVESKISWTASYKNIASNKYYLTSQSYKPLIEQQEGFEYYNLEDISEVLKGKSSSTKTPPGDYKLFLTAKDCKSSKHFDFEGDGVAVPLISSLGHGKAEIKRIHRVSGQFALANLLAFVKPNENIVLPDYLYQILDFRKSDMAKMMRGAANVGMKVSDIKGYRIPVPSLSLQEEIVSEIEGFQKIIDGAKIVLDNYKPKIEIDPDWEMTELNSLAEIISGYGFSSSDFKEDNPAKCIKITNVGVREFVDEDSSRLPETYLKEFSKYIVNTGDLVISLTRTIISAGLKVAVVPEAWDNTLVNQRVAGLKPNENANLNFIYHYLCSDVVYKYVEEQSRSLMQPNLSITDLKKMLIPNPPIETQNEIVTRIENEQELVNANKELIEIFEQKIKDRIAKVWGE